MDRRYCFNQRRKTLVNGLNNSPEVNVPKEAIIQSIESMGLAPTVRGETLTLQQFAQLSDEIEHRM